jgi:hypothetical protein
MNQNAVILRQMMRFALGCAAFAAGLSVTAGAQTWTPYTTLDTFDQGGFAGPVFDSLGNAWVVLDDNVNLSVVEYEASSGTWLTPYILGPWISGGQFAAALAADQSGDVYVVYNNTQNGDATNPLTWAKYTPASGWSAPAVAYNSPDPYGEVMAAFDSAGHLVVVFDANGTSSIVYDPATSSWGRVQNVVPQNVNAVLPSMAGNTNGSRLALVFLGHRGLEYSFFDSSKMRWPEPSAISGSEKVTFSAAADGSFIPVSVDPSGNVTAVTALIEGRDQFSVGGFHYDGTSWQMTQLVPASSFLTDIENEASIAQSPSGAVVVGVPTNFGTPAMTVFRYTPGVGWDTETAATINGYGTSTQCAIAWFLSGEAALAYLDVTAEAAALYAGSSWSNGPPIPGGYETFFPRVATAPNGDVLLVMSSAYTGTFGVVATWLEP